MQFTLRGFRRNDGNGRLAELIRVVVFKADLAQRKLA